MEAKLVTIPVVQQLRKGAKNEQGYRLRSAKVKASVRCRCCGQTIERGQRAMFIHLNLGPRFGFGSTCWFHVFCDPALAGNEERFELLEPVA